MSLINCPECGNECSATAAACPKCGHTFVKPAVRHSRVVVQEVQQEDSFPKWIFIPLALLGAVILFVIFAMLRNKDEDTAQKNINVNITSARPLERTLDNTITTTTSVPSTSVPSSITVPSTSAPSTITVPSTSQPSTVTSIPPSTTTTTVAAPPPTDKGSVSMQAKVLNRSGGAQPVSRVKFYLLDKDLNSILSEANINDEEGQGLVNAFGLSVVNPNKYRDTNQKAYAAIKRHIVYSTTTDGGGKADMKDIKPNNYYLFGITSTKNGFAMWNAPININTGQNSLILDPVTPTEIVVSNE